MASGKKKGAKSKKVFTSKTGESLELPPLPPLPKQAEKKKKSVFSIFHKDKKPDSPKKEKSDLKRDIFDRLTNADKDKASEPLIPPIKKESKILSFLSKPKKVKLDKFKADTKIKKEEEPKKEPKEKKGNFFSFLHHEKKKEDKSVKPEVKPELKSKKEPLKPILKDKPVVKKDKGFTFFKSNKDKAVNLEVKSASKDKEVSKDKPAVKKNKGFTFFKSDKKKIKPELKEIGSKTSKSMEQSSEEEKFNDDNMVFMAKGTSKEETPKESTKPKSEAVSNTIKNVKKVFGKISFNRPKSLGKPLAKAKLRDVLEPGLRKQLEPKVPQIKMAAPKPGKLLIKRHELEDKEVHLSEKEKHLETKEKEIHKKVKEHVTQATKWFNERMKRESVARNLDESLREKKAQIESHVIEFKTTDKNLKKLLVDIKRYKEDIKKVEQRKKQLESTTKKSDDKRKKELDNLQKKLQLREDAIKIKESHLNEKGSTITKRENDFSVKENQWRTDKLRRTSKLNELEGLVKDISIQLDQLRKDRNLQKKDFESDSSRYSKKLAELKKQLMEDENTIKQIEIRKKSIDDSMVERENKVKESENTLREHETELNKKETRLGEREEKLRDKDLSIKENLIPLNDMRRKIEEKTIEFSKQLTEAKKERMLRDEVLKKNKDFFRSIEPTIIKKVNQVEADEAMLSQEEQKIVNKVESLNKSTIKAQKAEASLASQKSIIRNENKHIKDEQKRIDKESRDLELKLARISKVKELKANIPILEKKYKQLQSLVGKEQVMLSKLTREAIAKREFLKDKEADIAKRELEEKDKEEWLTHLKTRMIHERRDLEEGKYKDYMQHELNKEQKEVFAGEEELPKKQPEIYDMIRQARGLISTKNIIEAKKIIDEIQNVYNTTNYDEQEKKKIYYEILELSTDLKLLALG